MEPDQIRDRAVTGAFKAFRVFENGGSIAGRIVDTTLDNLSRGTVVIKAAWSSVNYKDALAATGAGKIIRQFPLIGGIDVAGTVVEAADSAFKAGDSVLVTGYDLGVAHDGGYSQYVRVPSEWVVPIPTGLSPFDTMAIGTAGLTAALSVVEMERNGLAPGAGPVIVTGATGGVGSVAIEILAARGYQITALTGKESEAAYLRTLGASDVIVRSGLTMGTRPLEKATWAGAVDPVGGDVLAWLTRTMMYGGCIANSGLTAGIDLKTTVMPFILRGVKLLGIDSVMCPMSTRLEVWRRLANDLKPARLAAIARTIRLEDLREAFATLLDGRSRGRFVVDLS
jgi:acrylyl-CoA reductase (NADPH)